MLAAFYGGGGAAAAAVAAAAVEQALIDPALGRETMRQGEQVACSCMFHREVASEQEDACEDCLASDGLPPEQRVLTKTVSAVSDQMHASGPRTTDKCCEAESH